MESLIIGLSDDTNAISLSARVEERCPSLCEKSKGSEMVSGKKVKNVKHSREATFEISVDSLYEKVEFRYPLYGQFEKNNYFIVNKVRT